MMAPTGAHLNRLSRHRHADILLRCACVWHPDFRVGLQGWSRTTCTRQKRDGSRGLTEAPSLISVVRSSRPPLNHSFPGGQACRKMMHFSKYVCTAHFARNAPLAALGAILSALPSWYRKPAARPLAWARRQLGLGPAARRR